MFARSLLALGLVMCGSAHAKLFRNAYVSFELPPNWNCKLEGSEWVCENDFSAKTKEAIIILTAKEVGPTDTLPAYLAHLQTPRIIQGRGGAPIRSEIKHVKERMIGNHMWIDALHLGSEVGPYFTRYLATTKDRIAILVTFSAHKEHYTKYSADFIRAVESLRVVATKDTLGSAGGGGAGYTATGGQVGVSPGSVVDYQSDLPVEPPPRSNTKYFNYLLFALILAVVGAFLYYRSGPPPRSRGKKRR